MQPIIYDVAVSIDGFIAGAGGDVSLFAHDGPVVKDYQQRLATYSIALMGRNTYEFGYRFGMKPGVNPYPSMTTYVMSNSINLPKDREVTLIPSGVEEDVRRLKNDAGGPIYLCGGGELAGWLLGLHLIDRIVVKRAPIFLGQGTCLFGKVQEPATPKHLQTKAYGDGYILQEFVLDENTA